MQDRRHRRQGDDVVDDRRLSKQPLDRRQRRAHAHLTALAFETLEHRGLLAADVGTGAEPHFQIETLAAAHDIGAEVARLIGRGDGMIQTSVRVRVFGPQIDVALRGAHCDARNGHALHERQRVAFHHHAIGERTGITLVGIAGDVLLRRALLEDRLPLDAGWKRRTTAPAQAGVADGLNDRFEAQRQRSPQPLVAAVDHIVGHTRRINHTDAGESEALLARQPRDGIRRPESQRVLATVQEIRRVQTRHVGGHHGPVREPPASGGDFHERLEPVGSARAVAHQAQLEAASRGLPRDGLRDLARAEGESARIARNVDRAAHV